MVMAMARLRGAWRGWRANGTPSMTTRVGMLAAMPSSVVVVTMRASASRRRGAREGTHQRRLEVARGRGRCVMRRASGGDGADDVGAWTSSSSSSSAASLVVAGADGDGRGGKTKATSSLWETIDAVPERVFAWTEKRLLTWEPPKFIWRTAATSLLFGSVLFRMLKQPKRINWEQTMQQIARIGPQTLGVSLLTSSFVGMVFTIQFCKEFAKVGLKNAIGGLLGLAFARELTPVICAIILAGRIGSAIAAELGTMQVTEQVDQLTVLGTDPIDYLVIPRVIACAISLPVLCIISFAQSLAASILLADLRYGVSPNVIVDSAAKYLEPSDLGIMTAKAVAFGAVIAVISCGWGTTTTGGAKGVGESTTASVVISLTAIFIVDFVLSLIFFQK